jgi:hypothetical protein
LARIREETKKTYELNTKYRESIKNVQDGREQPEETRLNGNGKDEEKQEDLEHERKMLQMQQQEHQDAIRRAWGEPEVSLSTGEELTLNLPLIFILAE